MPRIRSYLNRTEGVCGEDIERLLGDLLDKDVSPPLRLDAEARVLRALSNPLRLSIVMLLREASLPVCLLSALLGVEQSRLSHHLAVLREAGVINMRVAGKYRLYSLIDAEAIDMLLEAVKRIAGKRGV